MPSQTWRQFIRFGTDAAGLERLLRLLQATTQVLAFVPLPFSALLYVLTLTSSPSSPAGAAAPEPARVRATLLALRGRFALGRRYFRFFRFAENLSGAYALYTAATPTAGKPLDVWLDIAGRSFNGLYLLLESASLPNALGVDGLALWDAATERAVNVEAQRLWFLALACGVAGGLVRLVHVFSHAPVPETGEGYGTGEKGREAKEQEQEGKEKSESKSESESGGGVDDAAQTLSASRGADGAPELRQGENGEEDAPLDWQKERERLRKIVHARKEQRRRWRREIKTRSRGLLRRIAADALDLAVPGAVIGWINAEPGTVGLLMLGSTILTGMEVWERCGREVAEGR